MDTHHGVIEMTFKIGENPIMIIEMNMDEHNSNLTYVTDDEIVMHPLFLPKERTYLGVEKRLQWWFNEPRTPLPDLMALFVQYGFLFDGQSSLRLDLKKLK